MTETYAKFKQGVLPQRKSYRVWPLYGAGFENLGREGQMLPIPMPDCGPDEMIIRHDACSLCFSDIKVIRAGQNHPRIYRNMAEDPVVLGHEVALTVVVVGENLKDQFKPGDRFILQAEIHVDGVNYAYGYEFQGGLSEFHKIDLRIIDGDAGSYLIPVQPETGYAESALSEPWACVNAAYTLSYREGIKDQGTAWFIGPESGRALTISRGFDASAHPAAIALTRMDGPLGRWLRTRAGELGIRVIEGDSPPEDLKFDDIFLLDPASEGIEEASGRLAFHGILAAACERPIEGRVNLDVGCIHYNRWLFIGGDDPDLAALYRRRPIPTSELKAGGQVLFVGAGGPMGRMHVQRALSGESKPARIVCSDVNPERLAQLTETFAAEAAAAGIAWDCVNPQEPETYAEAMAPFREDGFDDILILAPIPALVSECVDYLAEGGVMNIFAGIPRGNRAGVDYNQICAENVRLIGHSASTIEDMTAVLHKVEAGKLATNRSVAAIGSLEAVPAGLKAVRDGSFPGKIVIYPHLRPLPLTGLADLEKTLPSVYAKLKNGCEWTNAAEEELLRTMLLPIETDET
jgi:L-sorbose 1-phosphate reductase